MDKPTSFSAHLFLYLNTNNCVSCRRNFNLCVIYFVGIRNTDDGVNYRLCSFWCFLTASGLSGDTETAQSQVSVGMGLLAGSNVMLLTILWGTCLLVGKCDLENSVAVDQKDEKRFSLTGTFSYTVLGLMCVTQCL